MRRGSFPISDNSHPNPLLAPLSKLCYLGRGLRAQDEQAVCAWSPIIATPCRNPGGRLLVGPSVCKGRTEQSATTFYFRVIAKVHYQRRNEARYSVIRIGRQVHHIKLTITLMSLCSSMFALHVCLGCYSSAVCIAFITPRYG